jgi:hypothetical protein
MVKGAKGGSFLKKLQHNPSLQILESFEFF